MYRVTEEYQRNAETKVNLTMLTSRKHNILKSEATDVIYRERNEQLEIHHSTLSRYT